MHEGFSEIPQRDKLPEGQEKRLEIPVGTVGSRKDVLTALQRAYTPHALDNPKIEIRKTPQLGRGVYAQEDIQAGEVIAMFVGQTHRAKKISDLPNDPPDHMRDHVIQVGEEEYLHGKDGLAELVNHSCEPNCGIREKSQIVSMRDIKAGEQLTWDYAMTEDSDWSLDGCLCGSDRCRGTIGPYRDIPAETKKKYWDFTSEWLRQKYPHAASEYHTQTIHAESPEWCDKLLWELTWFFWWLFANDFAGQFLFYPSEGKPISAQQALGTPEGAYVPFETLKKFSPKDFPKHSETGEEARYWVDPETTFHRFKEKYGKKAIITVLRDERENIIGCTFGRKCTVLEAFQGEEWENPVCYSGINDPTKTRSVQQFVESINRSIAAHPELTEQSERATQLDEESEVYVWNCIAVSKNAHGKGHFWRLTTEFFSQIPATDQKKLWNIAEAVIDNTAYKLFKRARTIDVPEALQKGNQPQSGEGTIIITPLEDFARIFTRTDRK